jgi:hypothetical protein
MARPMPWALGLMTLVLMATRGSDAQLRMESLPSFAGRAPEPRAHAGLAGTSVQLRSARPESGRRQTSGLRTTATLQITARLTACLTAPRPALAASSNASTLYIVGGWSHARSTWLGDVWAVNLTSGAPLTSRLAVDVGGAPRWLQRRPPTSSAAPAALRVPAVCFDEHTSQPSGWRRRKRASVDVTYVEPQLCPSVLKPPHRGPRPGCPLPSSC